MNSIKLIAHKLTWVYPIMVIAAWHYIIRYGYLALAFRNPSPGLISLYQKLDMFIDVSLFFYLYQSLILAAITFFIVNRITPKATTWGLSFQLALLYGGVYLFFDGILTTMEAIADGAGNHWVGMQGYVFWNWRFPIALAFLPVIAACGRWGAYLGSKSMPKTDG